MRTWLMAGLVIGLFSPAVSFCQDESKADTDAVLQTEKVKPEPFSFRGIKFGSGVNEISGLVKSKCVISDPLVWYDRKDEKPINDVKVNVHFGFYKEKLIKIYITPLTSGQSRDYIAIDEALKKKYGNPQRASDICEKGIAKLWRGNPFVQVATNDGTWIEFFPPRLPPPPDEFAKRNLKVADPEIPRNPQKGEPWWLLNDRVLMRDGYPDAGAYIEITDVPLLIEAMKAAKREYKEQVNKAADDAAKNDF